MQNVAIIYNPASGQNHRGGSGIHEAVAVLEQAGLRVTLVPTEAAGSAGRQAKEAILAGNDTILACGGDGTVNEVLQGMVSDGPGGPEATLGVLPMGTANALASDLALPARNPAKAAKKLLTYKPRLLAALKTESTIGGEAEVRYSTVMSGVGADALLVYKFGVEAKQKLGMAGYLLYAAYLFLTHKMPAFHAEMVLSDGHWREMPIAQVMAIRIRQFGFPLNKLARGAALEKNSMRLILFRPHMARWNMWVYLHGALLHLGLVPPGVELVDAQSIVCRANDSNPQQRRIYAEADGEMLGRLPVTFTMVPRAFRLLVPAARAEAE